MDSEIIEEDTDGIICSIHVRNFFCHDNLQIDLNKNVNLVVGRNGSGKSAILTALVVGLGGRASATNRGSNLHSFIKKGANSATVEIKIKNSSSLAYKHHIYGDYITVARSINASGGSSYKIKNALGEVVSTKFEEVNNIVTAHNIQVDNPISVLNQDDVHSFHASDAKKKFMLFRKATNMDRTEINYAEALENCKKANNTWNRKSEAFEVLKKEFKKLKATHDRLQSHSAIEAQEKALENEYYWSEIVQFERETKQIETRYIKQQGKIEKLVEKLNEMEQNYGGNNGAIDSLKSQLEECTLQRSTLEQELAALETQARQAHTALRGLQASGAKHADLLRREQRKVTELRREIRSIESGSESGRRAELEAAAARAAEAAGAARARYDTARNDAAQAQQSALAAAAALERAAAAPQRATRALQDLKQQLRELETRGGDDSLAVYGANMVALVRAVRQAEQRGQFSAPPRGPVGAYLKVRDRRWGGALEHVLGGSVQAFCVNDDRDLRTLFDIMGKIYGKSAKPSVTCSKFLPRQHDVSRTSVRAGGHVSALGALVVDDPVVANYLIDNLGVEQILMVPEHAEAQRLSDRVENVPENCKKIVTLDTTEYHPAPSYRSYGGAARPSRYLLASSGERQRQLKAEIKQQEAELKKLAAEEERLKKEVAAAKEVERQAMNNVKSLMLQRQARDEAARAAAAALDTQQQPRHAVLEEELTLSEEKLATQTRQVEEWTQKEKEQREKIEGFEEAARATRAKLAEAAAACRNLEEEIERELLRAERGAAERRAGELRVREERAKLQLVRAALDDGRALIAAKVADAEKLCPRIDNPRDKETVMQEIEAAKCKLSSIRSEGRSKAEVEEELLRVEPQYRGTREQLQELRRLIGECQESTERHRHAALADQRSTAKLVQHYFNAMLTVNGYSGNMSIEFAKGLLEMSCTGREGRAAASTAALSGGERSYSTVAFVMALWACVEVPFYFLDEFDVFMDTVTRRKVMEALLKHARDNPARQFVFLTPQDASSVRAGPHTSIHVMADPRP